MKKLFCSFLAFAAILCCFSSCKEKNDNESEPVTEVKTFDDKIEFELGKEEKTSVVSNESEKQIYHIDDNGNYIILDHYNKQGKIVYYEEPLYNSDGNIKGYRYYDSKMILLASVDSNNNFFDKDGVKITENDFSKILNSVIK